MTPPTTPSPDVEAQVKAQLTTTRWTAASAIVVALLSLAGNIFQIVHNDSVPAPETARSAHLILEPFEVPGGNSNVGRVVDLTGPVSGSLAPDEMVWTFNQPLMAGGGHYPDTGPCPVSNGMWSCGSIYIGQSPTKADPKAGLGQYRIWASVVSDKEAYNIVTALRCQPSPTIPCSQEFSSLPGVDIAKPQFIIVTRTR